MKRWWVSWLSPTELYGKFELHFPWWVSGETWDGSKQTICAAIHAYTQEEAQQIVKECYDDCPPPIEWRFVRERPEDWSPFNDRFPKADWMQWPPVTEMALKSHE
jgi:hypothetical protein